MRSALEVADIVRRYGPQYRKTHGATLSQAQRRVRRSVEVCRTAVLGGQVAQCDTCGHRRIAYNSCRDRHCPKCQSFARAQWLEERRAELLETEYCHVVFTVPQEIAAIAYQNKRVVYNLVFRAPAETLGTIAADPQHLGAEIGFLAVLHTWGQTLLHHPHLHCVVPGGGIAQDGTRWIACRPGFFLPVRVLSRVFRRLFLEQLEHAYTSGQLQSSGALASLHEPQAFSAYLAPLRHGEWVVYAKKPFGSAQRVLDYLGRYTHRVAIANNRRLSLDQEQIPFRWKDYRQHDKQNRMTLTPTEFLRRFLLPVLPRGFQRLRPFGFLGNRYRQTKLALCRRLLAMAPSAPVPTTRLDDRDRYEQLTGKSLRVCPVYDQGQMDRMATLPARAWVEVPVWDSS